MRVVQAHLTQRERQDHDVDEESQRSPALLIEATGEYGDLLKPPFRRPFLVLMAFYALISIPGNLYAS